MTKNLLTLAAQLQSMEESMISIMFDVATKMATVSDIQFFLLIENQGRLQFTGSPHLKEAYSMSNFSELLDSEGPEVELQYDTTIMPKALLSSRKHAGNRKRQALRRNFDEANLSPESDQEKPQKKFKFEVDEEEVITLDENAVTSTRIDTSYLVDASSTSSSSALTPPNDQIGVIAFSSVIGPHCDARVLNDDIEGDERRSGEDISDNLLAVTRFSNAGEDTCSSTPWRCSLLPSADMATLPSSVDPSLIDWDVECFLENSDKMKYIQTIETPSLVLEKESAEFKLLHSLIYELSKNAATFCPFEATDTRTSQFFGNVFDCFWSRVPYLQRLQDDGVLPGDKTTAKYKNLKSLLRWKMQKNFGVLMRKYNVRSKITA